MHKLEKARCQLALFAKEIIQHDDGELKEFAGVAKRLEIEVAELMTNYDAYLRQEMRDLLRRNDPPPLPPELVRIGMELRKRH